MKANVLKGEELYDETVKLYNETKENIEKIRSSEYRLKKDAVNDWEKLESKITKNFDDMEEEELRSIYRDLKYINNLKSSTLEGAEQSYHSFKDVEDVINKLSEEGQKNFWDVYKHLYDENTNIGGVMYKYDVLREVATVAERFKGEQTSLENIEQILMKVIELISGDNYVDIHEEVMKHTFKLDGRFASANNIKRVLYDLPNLDDTTSEEDIDTSKYGWWL